jgi:hypothetical protein
MVPISPHRSCHGENPLVMLVPHFNDDITDIALHQSARSDLSRRVPSHLHGGVYAVQRGALVIGHEIRPVIKVEIEPGHSNLPSEAVSPNQAAGL